MARTGRPPIPVEDKRGGGVTVRLSEEEKRLVDAAAAGAGQKTGAWAREHLLRAAIRAERQQRHVEG